MDLDLDAILTPGRKRKRLDAQVTRALENSDLETLKEERGVEPQSIQRVSHRHHNLARMLAEGKTDAEAAVLCGYTQSRVSILKRSDAFKDLLLFYKKERDDSFRELYDKLAGLAGDAADELALRLEDEPEEISTTQLMELVKLGADRTGYGPTHKQETTVNVNLAEKLALARKRAETPIIDITPIPEDDA